MQWYGIGRLTETVHTVAFTTVSVAAATAIGSQTRAVRCVATEDCYVVIGDAPTTATTVTGAFLPAREAESFVVTPGQKVAAIRATTSGVLNVVELA